jgi:hypothetical protein
MENTEKKMDSSIIVPKRLSFEWQLYLLRAVFLLLLGCFATGCKTRNYEKASTNAYYGLPEYAVEEERQRQEVKDNVLEFIKTDGNSGKKQAGLSVYLSLYQRMKESAAPGEREFHGRFGFSEFHASAQFLQLKISELLLRNEEFLKSTQAVTALQSTQRECALKADKFLKKMVKPDITFNESAVASAHSIVALDACDIERGLQSEQLRYLNKEASSLEEWIEFTRTSILQKFTDTMARGVFPLLVLGDAAEDIFNKIRPFPLVIIGLRTVSIRGDNDKKNSQVDFFLHDIAHNEAMLSLDRYYLDALYKDGKLLEASQLEEKLKPHLELYTLAQEHLKRIADPKLRLKTEKVIFFVTHDTARPYTKGVLNYCFQFALRDPLYQL